VTSADLLGRVWGAAGGEPDLLAAVRLVGPDLVLPAAFDVTGLATATVAAASLAIAEYAALTSDCRLPEVRVDSRAACAAFVSEQLFTPIGWTRAPAWDALAGDYRAGDGWLRLHTNYSYHRAALQRVLGPVTDHDAVAAAVLGWSADQLESAVVAAGGCAAVMNDRDSWQESAPGRAAAIEALIGLDISAAHGGPPLPGGSGGPLAGVRVLDLTRVIAEPVCTRLLAGYGADVLRIEPVGFQEVPALLPETTAGKRCAALDLRSPVGRATFARLVAQAHVLVGGLRADALAGLGFDDPALRTLNPNLILARLNAYGWSGPWRDRRGFDSLVQMSCGIAAGAGQSVPRPLPAQALDHGTGYLLATAVIRALTRRHTHQTVSTVRCSLAATANVLMDYPVPAAMSMSMPQWSDQDTEPTHTAWGAARRVPIPGRITGIDAALVEAAGPLGRHPATFRSQ
jgi:hypothetical protein